VLLTPLTKMANMKVGQLAGPNDRFCPYAAVNKWPYRHLHGDESERVSSKFFASGEFRSRGWTMQVSVSISYKVIITNFRHIHHSKHIHFVQFWAMLQIPSAKQSLYRSFSICPHQHQIADLFSDTTSALSWTPPPSHYC